MKYRGNELLSRTTIASHRTLLGISTAIIFVEVLGLNLDSLSVFGVNFNESQIDSISLYIIVILFFAHILNWTGDYVSAKKWNFKFADEEAEIFWGGRSPLKGQLELLFTDIENTLRSMKGDQSFDETVEAMECNILSIQRRTDKLDGSLFRFSVFLRIYFFGWCLFVPIMLALYACYLIYG